MSVYPVFESLDISSVSSVRPTPLRVLRFLLDVHVGRLAAYLRMAGFDALYGKQTSDSELAGIVARKETRVAHSGSVSLDANCCGSWLLGSLHRTETAVAGGGTAI